MNLPEDEFIQKYGKRCEHCNRNTLLPYEYEWICISCGFNLTERKHELSKIQRKIIFINRLKYGEQKIFCICVGVYKIFEGDDFDEIFQALSAIKKEIKKIIS